MQFINVRDFKINATRYLNSGKELIITRYGKPIARVTPENENSISQLLETAGQILKDAGISEKEALNVIKKTRKKKSRS